MIVDASALLLLADSRSDPHLGRRLESAYRAVQQAEPFESPALVAAEIGHAVHRKRREAFGKSLAERCELVRRLVRSTALALPMPTSSDLCGELSESAGLSYYDATYLSLARFNGLALLTADAGMAAHAKAQAVRAYLMPDDIERLEADFPPT